VGQISAARVPPDHRFARDKPDLPGNCCGADMRLIHRLRTALAPTGRPSRASAVAQLEDQLAAERAAAREREEFLSSVMDAAPVAMVLLGEDGNIVLTNAGARELFFDGSNPRGKNFLAMLSEVPEPLRKALLSETDHLFTFESAGESEVYHLAKRRLSLRQQPHSLLIVRHMTQELSRQENAVLRKAIRVIHHEFANSLTPVVSLLHSARRRVAEANLDPALGQILTVIQEGVSHLNAFLSGFSALGRLPRPRRQVVSWPEFIDGLRPLLAGVTVAPPPAAPGWFDPAQIQQVIINLVKNAREAGSPEVALEVSPVPEGGTRTSVLDRGSGMTDEVLENAMVPSFTTKPSGSGMGLALCREIIDAHQGHLRIARREGGGTAVSFWLPSREPAAATVGASRARLSLSRDLRTGTGRSGSS
jgi:two-component system, NtrC family, nitrogen regulation sensor histidine kinase NtrY